MFKSATRSIYSRILSVLAGAIYLFVLAPALPVQAEVVKPKIAVKALSVGEKVSESARRHLDLELLVNEMLVAVQNTRKFEVQNRDKAVLKAVRSEQMLSDEDVDIQGADYIVVGTVQDFVYYRSVKPVPNIDNKYSRTDSGRLVVAAKIIDVASNSVKITFSLSDKFATGKKITNEKGGSPMPTHFAKMSRGVAAQLANQLVDTVFPMVVINTKADSVWVNRGQDGGLKNGEVLQVYRTGEALVDPYTGETLGTEEEFIGKVKVDRINPKFTICKTLKGVAVAKGDIVRRP